LAIFETRWMNAERRWWDFGPPETENIRPTVSMLEHHYIQAQGVCLGLLVRKC